MWDVSVRLGKPVAAVLNMGGDFDTMGLSETKSLCYLNDKSFWDLL